MIGTWMRSVQGLKDRARSCSISNAMFGGFKPLQTKPGSESTSDTSQQARQVSYSGDTAQESEAAEESRRLREAAKAEKVMHLICWEPQMTSPYMSPLYGSVLSQKFMYYRFTRRCALLLHSQSSRYCN
ncbi:hypothetical protein CRG98_044559 [Punica granatum]|uniref:Uncharacterized protein n=1 Tax=Punica granatum TaxID=22663 RepID=A0A2I0HTK7_PUNGR|nr:hypothetical protein CRG98_044559 [Punica granatum]